MSSKPVSEVDLRRAVAAGRRAGQAELRATKVRYDPKGDRIDLAIGDALRVWLKRNLIAEFAKVPPAAMRKVALSPAGTTLELTPYDIHISIDGLFASLVSPRTLARTMAKRGGSSTSRAKQRSARENGKKGGRPRKVA